MKFSRIWSSTWRFLVLTISLTAISILARQLLPRPEIIANTGVPSDPGRMLGSLIFVYALYSLFMQFVAGESKTGGARLYLALVCAYVGFGTLMMQIETLFFKEAFPRLSAADIGLLALNGLITGSVFSALVLIVTGRTKQGPVKIEGLVDSIRRNGAVIGAGAVVYPIIYFVFGFFVAYGSQATVDFYGSTTATSATFALAAFQVLRGGLWALLSIPLVGLMRRKEDLAVSLAAGLPLFTAMGLIFQNPLMPEAVRYAHGFELTSSMLLFGAFLGLMFSRKRQPNG